MLRAKALPFLTHAKGALRRYNVKTQVEVSNHHARKNTTTVRTICTKNKTAHPRNAEGQSKTGDKGAYTCARTVCNSFLASAMAGTRALEQK